VGVVTAARRLFSCFGAGQRGRGQGDAPSRSEAPVGRTAVAQGRPDGGGREVLPIEASCMFPCGSREVLFPERGAKRRWTAAVFAGVVHGTPPSPLRSFCPSPTNQAVGRPAEEWTTRAARSHDGGPRSRCRPHPPASRWRVDSQGAAYGPLTCTFHEAMDLGAGFHSAPSGHENIRPAQRHAEARRCGTRGHGRPAAIS